jgi:hypothetical protein
VNLRADRRCLHVLLVVGPDWRMERSVRAQELAGALRSAGHAATVLAAPARREPAFRQVMAPLQDAHLEHAAAVAIRAGNFDLVHAVGCAGGASVHVPWIARALGVPCTIEVEPAIAVCHRGDLLHSSGAPCAIVDDPARCAACCRARTAAGRRGLGDVQAGLAWATRWLGDAAPFPTSLAFRNRRDLIAAGLAEAHAVVVRDDASLQAVRGLGVPDSRIHLLQGSLLPLWSSLT